MYPVIPGILVFQELRVHPAIPGIRVGPGILELQVTLVDPDTLDTLVPLGIVGFLETLDFQVTLAFLAILVSPDILEPAVTLECPVIRVFPGTLVIQAFLATRELPAIVDIQELPGIPEHQDIAGIPARLVIQVHRVIVAILEFQVIPAPPVILERLVHLANPEHLGTAVTRELQAIRERLAILAFLAIAVTPVHRAIQVFPGTLVIPATVAI